MEDLYKFASNFELGKWVGTKKCLNFLVKFVDYYREI